MSNDITETSWDSNKYLLLKGPLYKGGSREAGGGCLCSGASGNPDPPVGFADTPLCERGAKTPRNSSLTPFARDLRNNQTKQEKHLWFDFLSKRKPRFLRQHIIGPYIADFYCSKAYMVIELDGSQHYTDESIAYDAERTAYLNSIGLKVLRFSNEDIDKRFDEVCEAIEEAVRERKIQVP